MDWARAIERNSEALKGIVATLFAMLGLVGDATVARLPPSLHSAVLRLLRPAESAVRRLIVIAARGLEVKPAPSRAISGHASSGRACTARPSLSSSSIRGKTSPSYVEDTPPRILPRIHVFGNDPRVAALWQHPGPKPVPLHRPMAS